MAFHLYPQLISRFCNSEEFGLPRSFTSASSWPWVAHLVSGLLPATLHRFSAAHALFRLAFAAAPGVRSLNLATESNSLAHSPRGTRLVTLSSNLPLLVSIRFQVLFHSGHPGPFHLSLAVLVHYRSPKVFSLGEWTPLLPTGLACPMVLKITAGAPSLSDTGLSPPPVGLSSAFLLAMRFVTPSDRCSGLCHVLLPPPRNAYMLTRVGFGLFPFRSPLLRESFLFLRVLRCFSSPRAPH